MNISLSDTEVGGGGGGSSSLSVPWVVQGDLVVVIVDKVVAVFLNLNLSKISCIGFTVNFFRIIRVFCFLEGVVHNSSSCRFSAFLFTGLSTSISSSF